MTAKGGVRGEGGGYARQLRIHAEREWVFDAITTLDGLHGWWTTTVTGSTAPGGELCFEFAGTDEQIVMHVDEVRPPAVVAWSYVAHTRDDKWTGSTVRFGLVSRRPQACELDFRHTRIERRLVAQGWEHLLASLAAHTERGEGSPYGT